jgi:hypothetical protein
MNTPARFESLLWMASPMLAWAQAGADAPTPKAGRVKPGGAHSEAPHRTRRKRRKALA